MSKAGHFMVIIYGVFKIPKMYIIFPHHTLHSQICHTCKTPFSQTHITHLFEHAYYTTPVWNKVKTHTYTVCVDHL